MGNVNFIYFIYLIRFLIREFVFPILYFQFCYAILICFLFVFGRKFVGEDNAKNIGANEIAPT